MWFLISHHKNKVSLISCIFLSIVLIFWQTRSINSALSYLSYLTNRFSSFASLSIQSFNFYWVPVEEHRILAEKYERTLQQLNKTKLEKDKFDLLVAENNRFRKIIGYNQSTEYPETTAEVLAIRVNSISPHIIIGKGEKSGIRPFMPVITRTIDDNDNYIRCIVGLVVAVYGRSSLIQPISHPEFQMGVRFTDSGEWAVLQGNSGSTEELLLYYIVSNFHSKQVLITQENEKEIEINSQIVSSGNGGIYPRGIPVGRVTRIGRISGGFKTAYVRPYTTINRLDQVTVILKERDKWTKQEKNIDEWQKNLESEFGQIKYNQKTEVVRSEKKEKTNATNKKTDVANQEGKLLKNTNQVKTDNQSSQQKTTQEVNRRTLRSVF